MIVIITIIIVSGKGSMSPSFFTFSPKSLIGALSWFIQLDQPGLHWASCSNWFFSVGGYLSIKEVRYFYGYIRRKKKCNFTYRSCGTRRTLANFLASRTEAGVAIVFFDKIIFEISCFVDLKTYWFAYALRNAFSIRRI